MTELRGIRKDVGLTDNQMVYRAFLIQAVVLIRILHDFVIYFYYH
jgi:hypothetical protein